VSEWRSLVDQLLALDPDDWDPADLADDELLAGIVAVQSGLNRLSARLTRMVRAAEVRRLHEDEAWAR
jgi:hypothetical protein